MIQTFPQKSNSTEMEIEPSGNNLFDNGNGKLFGKSQAEYFHTIVSKAVFLSNRVRTDIHPTISVLATRVISPNIVYEKKWVRVLTYLNVTRKYHLKLIIDDIRVIKWNVDTSFTVHPYFKSHAGRIIMWVTGVTQTALMKQKLNTGFSIQEDRTLVILIQNILFNVVSLILNEQFCPQNI